MLKDHLDSLQYNLDFVLVVDVEERSGKLADQLKIGLEHFLNVRSEDFLFQIIDAEGSAKTYKIDELSPNVRNFRVDPAQQGRNEYLVSQRFIHKFVELARNESNFDLVCKVSAKEKGFNQI